MTLEQINEKLGRNWFTTGSTQTTEPATSILYADGSEVVGVILKNVFQVEDRGDCRVLYEWVGQGPMPYFLEIGEDWDEDDQKDIREHNLDKWQCRGCCIV